LLENVQAKKAFIIYYASDLTHSNEEKVASLLQKLFNDKNISAEKILLEPKEKLTLKQQLRMEKKIELANKQVDLSKADYVIIGSPVVDAITSSPIVNSFIRGFEKKDYSSTKFVLFSCGIIPGLAIKKMSSLLAVNGIKVFDSQAFSSMFEFDKKKLIEAESFFNRFF